MQPPLRLHCLPALQHLLSAPSAAPLPCTHSALASPCTRITQPNHPTHPTPPLPVYGDPTVVGFDGSRFTLGGAPGDRVTLLTGSYSACIDAATGVPTTCTVPTVTNFWMRGRLIAGPSSQGTWAAPATGGRPLPTTALESMSLQFGDSLWVYVQQRQLYAVVQNVPVRPGTQAGGSGWWGGGLCEWSGRGWWSKVMCAVGSGRQTLRNLVALPLGMPVTTTAAALSPSPALPAGAHLERHRRLPSRQAGRAAAGGHPQARHPDHCGAGGAAGMGRMHHCGCGWLWLCCSAQCGMQCGLQCRMLQPAPGTWPTCAGNPACPVLLSRSHGSPRARAASTPLGEPLLLLLG